MLTPRFLSYRLPAHNPSNTTLHRRHIHHWSGLHRWRTSPLNPNRTWAPKPEPEPKPESEPDPILSSSSLAECGSIILSTPDPLTKSRLSHLAFSRWHRRELPVGSALPPTRPARPAKPVLVSPKEIPSHKRLGMPLNAYMLHNLAHVELNAVDLAWDTVVRFSEFRDELGDEFFGDFARVADDEGRHFGWCQQRLVELGFR